MSNLSKHEKIERLLKVLSGKAGKEVLKPVIDKILIGGKIVEFENSETDTFMMLNDMKIYL